MVPSKPTKRSLMFESLTEKPKKTISLTGISLKLADKLSTTKEISPKHVRESSPLKIIDDVENDLVSAKITDFALKLDYYNWNQHLYLIKTRIESWIDKRDSKSEAVLQYYLDNMLIANTEMVYNVQTDLVKSVPKHGIWVYHNGTDFLAIDGSNHSNPKLNVISEDSEIIEQIVKRKPSLVTYNKASSEEMYGLINDDNDQKEKRFKIYDTMGEKKNLKIKKYSEKEDLKSRFRGKICTIYKQDDLRDFCKRLKIDYASADKNRALCTSLEKALRQKDLDDPNYHWFYNYFQYNRSLSKRSEDYFPDKLFQLYKET